MELLSLPRLRGRVGERVPPQARTPERREPSPGAPRRPLPQAGEVQRVRGRGRRHSASALYFFSEALSSAMAASGSAPVFLTPSDQVLTSGSAAFFQAAVWSGVSL